MKKISLILILFFIFTSNTEPVLFSSFFQGFSSVSLYEREILFALMSIETIFTLIDCEADKIFAGWIFLFVHDNSLLWIKPSTPSSSFTKTEWVSVPLLILKVGP